MPGSWTAVTSICASRQIVASSSCTSWADQGMNSCSTWADHGSNQCTSWADEGHSQCCTWWPCSWFCDLFYWVANWVCQAVIWVSRWVCLAWFWIARWVCLAWATIVRIFCVGGNGGPMFLLTDGSVLLNECTSGYGTRRWWKLQPDLLGTYVNSTWIRMADSNIARKYFASAVFADGRIIVCGGEYSDASGVQKGDDTNACEIYDPVANSWTVVPAPPGITQIGDSACALLPDGRFLLGNFNSTACFIFDPNTGAWVTAASKSDSASEETWVLMPNDTVLVPEVSASPAAEKYLIASDQWVADGLLTARIDDATTDVVAEVGPGFLLPDGRAFFVGANGKTALYTMGAAATIPGTWAVGPASPRSGRQNQGAKDGPGVLLPSGTVLFPVAPVDGLATNSQYLAPCTFVEFDGTNLSVSTNPPNSNCPTFVGRMLIIPTGQALWTREDDSGIFAFTETGSPQNSFRPAITAAPNVVRRGSTIKVSGTQFNGLSQAVGYGDDQTTATNYPIVRIRSSRSGRIFYCRTFNHTRVNAGGTTVSSMGVATGPAVVTTQVAVPGNVDIGDAQLFVVANGNASLGRAIVVTA
jgi:hypothetical protein